MDLYIAHFVLPTNVRLRCNYLPRANTLAYFGGMWATRGKKICNSGRKFQRERVHLKKGGRKMGTEGRKPQLEVVGSHAFRSKSILPADILPTQCLVVTAIAFWPHHLLNPCPFMVCVSTKSLSEKWFSSKWRGAGGWLKNGRCLLTLSGNREEVRYVFVCCKKCKNGSHF